MQRASNLAIRCNHANTSAAGVQLAALPPTRLMAPVYPNLLGMCATICSKACLTEGVVAEGVVIEGATDGRGDPSTA
jgi:hypothetical protein